MDTQRDDDAQIEAVEQPGGVIFTRGGVPIGVASLERASVGSVVSVHQCFPWLAPLTESAILHGKAYSERGACVVTPWGDDERGDYSDEDQHRAYVAHVRGFIEKVQPWLWPMFETARANIIIVPGGFSFSLDTFPGCMWDVPDFGPIVALEPDSYADAVKH